MKLQRKSTTHTVLKTLHFTPELKKMLGETGMRKIGPACLPMKLIEHCVPCGFSLALALCVVAIEILVLERKNPCKKSAGLHPRRGSLLQRNIFTGLNKTSLYNTK
jgi:hypothetical protein